MKPKSYSDLAKRQIGLQSGICDGMKAITPENLIWGGLQLAIQKQTTLQKACMNFYIQITALLHGASSDKGQQLTFT